MANENLQDQDKIEKIVTSYISFFSLFFDHFSILFQSVQFVFCTLSYIIHLYFNTNHFRWKCRLKKLVNQRKRYYIIWKVIIIRHFSMIAFGSSAENVCFLASVISLNALKLKLLSPDSIRSQVYYSSSGLDRKTRFTLFLLGEVTIFSSFRRGKLLYIGKFTWGKY